MCAAHNSLSPRFQQHPLPHPPTSTSPRPAPSSSTHLLIDLRGRLPGQRPRPQHAAAFGRVDRCYRAHQAAGSHVEHSIGVALGEVLKQFGCAGVLAEALFVQEESATALLQGQEVEALQGVEQGRAGRGGNQLVSQ